MRTMKFSNETDNSIRWGSAVADVSYDMWQDIRDTAKDRFGFDSDEYIESGAKICLGLSLNHVIDHLRMEGLSINNSIRMLNAHGAVHPEAGWVYCDMQPGNEQSYLVNDWIKQHEGNYDVLFVHSCNPGKFSLPRAKSTIVYPRDTFDSNAMGRGLMYGKNEMFSIV